MTINGWIQIALYCVIIIAITKPIGGYMTRVFNGERTWFSPILRPIERVFYAISGVDEKEDQHWLTYAVAMLAFTMAGFVSLYAIQRLQAMLPFNPQKFPAVGEHLAFNTSVSFITNTNWQSYTPETTMSYLVQMAGLTVHNFLSAATGIALAVALVRGFARRSAKGVGNFWVDMTRCTLYILLPISIVVGLFFVWQGMPQNLNAYVTATTLEGVKQTIAHGAGRFAGSDQDGRHQWRRILQRQFGASLRESECDHQSGADHPDLLAGRGPHEFVRPHGRQSAPGLGDFCGDGPFVSGRRDHRLCERGAGKSGLRGIPCRPDRQRAAGRRQYGRQGSSLRHRKFLAVHDGYDRCLLRGSQHHA